MPHIKVLVDKDAGLFQLLIERPPLDDIDGPVVMFGEYATVSFGEDVYVCRMMSADSKPKVKLITEWEDHGHAAVEEEDLHSEDEEGPEDNDGGVLVPSLGKIT